MPTFSRHDIDTMGFKVAEEFRNGSTLHDSIVKIAKHNQMNPEQIKRLVESANTTAFLNEFKGKSGNQRMVEFDVADPSRVIDEALGSSGPTSGAPSISITISVDSKAGLHDTVSDENNPLPELEPKSDKVASYLGPLFTAQEDTLSLDINQSERARDSLLTKIASCNYGASDLADEISYDYRGIYTREKHASFELDAYSVHGNSAVPALQLVRNRLGMPKIARALTPQEEFVLADRHVVDQENKGNLAKVAQILELVDSHNQHKAAIDYLAKVTR